MCGSGELEGGRRPVENSSGGVVVANKGRQLIARMDGGCRYGDQAKLLMN